MQATPRLFLTSLFCLALSLLIGCGNQAEAERILQEQQIEAKAASLKSLPMEIGNWAANEEHEFSNDAAARLQIQNQYISRTYRNRQTGEVVYLTLMLGPTEIIAVHTPEPCFDCRDDEKEATPRTRVPITVQLSFGEGEIEDTFWRASRSLDANYRILFYYAISAGEAWNAAENPLETFHANRYVYRILIQTVYAIQAEEYADFGEEGDAIKRFLMDSLPTIHEHLRWQ